MKKYNQSKCIKCRGCITAVFVIQTVIILVLVFTVFPVKDSRSKMDSAKIEGLDLASRANFRPGANLTVVASVPIKNPNMASFKFKNVTTNLYCNGIVIGEARTPQGIARQGGLFEPILKFVINYKSLLIKRLLWISKKKGVHIEIASNKCETDSLWSHLPSSSSLSTANSFSLTSKYSK